MIDEDKPSEEFLKFDKAMDNIMAVSKEELNRRLAAAKKAKTGRRYLNFKEESSDDNISLSLLIQMPPYPTTSIIPLCFEPEALMSSYPK